MLRLLLIIDPDTRERKWEKVLRADLRTQKNIPHFRSVFLPMCPRPMIWILHSSRAWTGIRLVTSHEINNSTQTGALRAKCIEERSIFARQLSIIIICVLYNWLAPAICNKYLQNMIIYVSGNYSATSRAQSNKKNTTEHTRIAFLSTRITFVRTVITTTVSGSVERLQCAICISDIEK